MPHLVIWYSLPVRRACMRSAAKTPNWQENDDRTSTIVLVAENGTLSFSVCSAHRSGDIERSVK